MSETSRLFYQPVSGRDEPPVVSSPAGTIPFIPQEQKELDGFVAHYKEVEYLAQVCDIIIQGYEDVIEVYRRRGRLMKASLNLSLLLPANTALSGAVKIVYGTQLSEISFDQFVDLLKYEQVCASVYAGSIANPGLFTDIQQGIKNSEMINSRESSAISAIKSAFMDYLIEAGMHDLLPVTIAVNKQAANGSNKAVAVTMLTTASGTSVLSAIPSSGAVSPPVMVGAATSPAPATSPPVIVAPVTSKTNLKKIEEDCFSCWERSWDGLDFKKPSWAAFNGKNIAKELYKQYKQQLLGELQQLAMIKQMLTLPSVTGQLCRIIGYMTEYVCLPDLVAVMGLITMSLNSLLADLSASFKFKFNGAKVAGDLASIILKPIHDIIMANVIKIFSGILSPIDCVITSLEDGLRKVSPAVSGAQAGYESLGGTKSKSDWNTSAQNALIGARKFSHDTTGEWITYIRKNKDKWELWVNKLLGESKKFELSIQEAIDEIINLAIQIDAHKQKLSIIQEVIEIRKKYNLLQAGNKLKGLTAKQIYETICRDAYTNKPWIEYFAAGIVDAANKLGITDTLQQLSNSINGTDFATGSSQSGGRADIVGYLVDTSVPADFLSRPDLSTEAGHGAWQDLTPEYSLELGAPTNALSQSFLESYTQHKEQFTANVLPGQSSSSLDTPVEVPVVGVFDFIDCINRENLAGYSQAQLDNWIKKLATV